MYELNPALDKIDLLSLIFIRDFGQDFPQIIAALLAAEDHRAHDHGGIDGRSIARSAYRAMQGTKFGGVSTIEQQLARTIYPRRGRNLFLAKVQELILSLRIAKRRPKYAIWCAYLMLAYYGTGLDGYKAARAQFCRSGGAVTRRQAASIVSCLKYPRPQVPSARWKSRHRVRVEYVIGRMSQ